MLVVSGSRLRLMNLIKCGYLLVKNKPFWGTMVVLGLIVAWLVLIDLRKFKAPSESCIV